MKQPPKGFRYICKSLHNHCFAGTRCGPTQQIAGPSEREFSPATSLFCKLMYYGKSPFLMEKLTIDGHFQKLYQVAREYLGQHKFFSSPVAQETWNIDRQR